MSQSSFSLAQSLHYALIIIFCHSVTRTKNDLSFSVSSFLFVSPLGEKKPHSFRILIFRFVSFNFVTARLTIFVLNFGFLTTSSMLSELQVIPHKQDAFTSVHNAASHAAVRQRFAVTALSPCRCVLSLRCAVGHCRAHCALCLGCSPLTHDCLIDFFTRLTRVFVLTLHFFVLRWYFRVCSCSCTLCYTDAHALYGDFYVSSTLHPFGRHLCCLADAITAF